MIYEKSAGAIIFNDDKFLLLKYGYGHWGFVKGNIEEKENAEETIKRELEEETGIKKCEIMKGFKEKINYFYKKEGETVLKKVVYYLLKTSEEEVRLSYEHDDYKWLGFEEALEKLSFENAKKVLKKAKKYLEKNI